MPFWNTKPVSVAPLNPASLTLIQTNHGFQPNPDPPPSPALEWDAFTLDDPEKLAEYHRFLTEHYKTHGFPFQIVYTLDHLRMELSSSSSSGGAKPGNWVVVLRSIKTKTIVAGIAGGVRSLAHTVPDVPPDALQNVLMIGFLCIHSSFRKLGLAPALIHEISRRANQSSLGIQKAYYSSMTKLPGCFCSTPNLSRPINILTCIQTDYIPSPPPAFINYFVRHSAPKATPWRFRRVQPTDSIDPLLALVNAYNARHRKVYEPLTQERWETLCKHTECIDLLVVSREDSLDTHCAVLTLVRHPYRRTSSEGASSPIALTIGLLHYYGFAASLTATDQHAIWDAFFRYAHASALCDVFSTIHPDIADAFGLGFAKTHEYHHYLYNVHAMPLFPQDITMIGI